MRVMVIVRANEKTESGKLPSPEELKDMVAFNEELVRAGVLLGMDGLHPSSQGRRVSFSGGTARVLDGPFTETKELIAGYWLWQVRSLDEAVEWIRRSPFRSQTQEIEIRRVFDAEDFGANLSPELRAQEECQLARATAATRAPGSP
ncbi:MAG: YciI family protein [Proteobacteria bacterium]|nr:YciI family protein [Pseudomonadota bacterium]